MKSMKILLVEDNEGDAVLAMKALKASSYLNEVCHINDGEKALAYLSLIENSLSKNIPDLILLDINIPRINGIELLKMIKYSPVLRSIPVIVFTTSNLESDVTLAYQNFANVYITKPQDLKQFQEVILTINHYWSSIVSRESKILNTPN